MRGRLRPARARSPSRRGRHGERRYAWSAPTIDSSRSDSSSSASIRARSRSTTRSGRRTPIRARPASKRGNSFAAAPSNSPSQSVDLNLPRRRHAIDGSFRTAPVSLDLVRLHEAATLETLDDAVERPVVESDALVLATRPHRGSHLVRMHRAFREAGEHGEGERVGPLATRHQARLPFILGSGYTAPVNLTRARCGRAPRVLPRLVWWPNLH